MPINVSTLTKIASVVLVGGGIAGAGTAYALSSKTKVTIKDKLNKENKKLLISDGQSLWDIKLATYNRIKGTDNKFQPTTETWQGLKEWCSLNADKEASDENNDLYTRIKEVCTVPSHREKFKSASKELAGTADWPNKGREYTGTGDKAILGIEKNATINSQLETWCEKALDKEYEDDQKNDYPLVLKWCTKAGN